MSEAGAKGHALEVWLATANEKKAGELRRYLQASAPSKSGNRVRTLDELDAAGGEPFTVVEDAPDFAGNARKKALAAADWLARRGVDAGALVVADDSGLCVDALGGRPGVHSARYAGERASDADRIAKLLGELAGVPAGQRTARFVCALCAVHVDRRDVLSTEAHCSGKIIEAPEGSGGFGYDPVFVPDDAPPGREGATFAALDAREKDRVSHRGKALRALAAHLENLPDHRSHDVPDSAPDSVPDNR